MRHAIIGTLLILYSLLLTPAYIEPSDVIVSTAFLAGAASVGVPIFIITLWIISGYIALIIGAVLLGHSIWKHAPTLLSGAKNPMALILLVAFVALVVFLWFYYAS